MTTKYNPELLLKEGDIFFLAYQIIQRKNSDLLIQDNNEQKAIWVNDAALMNHAYAFEMYLNCLMCIEGKEIKDRGHNLENKFVYLNEETKNIILDDYNSTVIFHPAYFVNKDQNKKTDFVSMLKQTPRAFVHLRYKYDSNYNYQNYELEPAINSVRATILKLRPELKGFR